MSDGFKLKGDVHITRTNAIGELTGEWDFKNLIVTSGLQWVAGMLSATPPAVMNYIAIGTDNTVPASNQVALFNEIARSAITQTGGAVSGTTITYIAVFGPGAGTGALYEAGIFQQNTGSIMLSRVTYPVINKGASDTITVQWTISGS